jgi:hypothetical protein
MNRPVAGDLSTLGLARVRERSDGPPGTGSASEDVRESGDGGEQDDGATTTATSLGQRRGLSSRIRKFCSKPALRRSKASAASSYDPNRPRSIQLPASSRSSMAHSLGRAGAFGLGSTSTDRFAALGRRNQPRAHDTPRTIPNEELPCAGVLALDLRPRGWAPDAGQVFANVHARLPMTGVGIGRSDERRSKLARRESASPP